MLSRRATRSLPVSHGANYCWFIYYRNLQWTKCLGVGHALGKTWPTIFAGTTCNLWWKSGYLSRLMIVDLTEHPEASSKMNHVWSSVLQAQQDGSLWASVLCIVMTLKSKLNIISCLWWDGRRRRPEPRDHLSHVSTRQVSRTFCNEGRLWST